MMEDDPLSTSLCEAEFERIGLRFWTGQYYFSGASIKYNSINTTLLREAAKKSSSLNGRLMAVGKKGSKKVFFP